MIHRPRWHLRSSLTLLLIAASAIALLIAFALLLAYYQPRLAAQTRTELAARSDNLARHTERVLSFLQGQLELIAANVKDGDDDTSREQMDYLIHQGAF